jgi:mRNA-binding protein PUF3
VSELNVEGRVIKCVKDQNGNHVIQKAIEVIPSRYIQFIYDAILGSILDHTTHPYGCRVVQRMLEKNDADLKAKVLLELGSCRPDVITDQYGNYVAQHVIAHGDYESRNRMICLVLNDIHRYSTHKFASNVVEKCIAHGSIEQQRTITRTIVEGEGKEGKGKDESLLEYVKCPFGNYVIRMC